jgi:hypothetical protein
MVAGKKEVRIMSANGETMKVVYTVVERSPGKSSWTRIGVGFVNRDGSMNLKLDAVPVNGTLQVRDWEDRDSFQRPPGQSAVSPSSMPPRQRQEPGLANAPSAPGGSRTRGSNDAAGGLA